MAVIKPFACVRPAKDLVSKVAALPYDVYNREEARNEVKRIPCHFWPLTGRTHFFLTQWEAMSLAFTKGPAGYKIGRAHV